MAAALVAFQRASREDRFEELPADALLARLEGVDVLLMFIESYGRSALEQERYAGTAAAAARRRRRSASRPPGCRRPRAG